MVKDIDKRIYIQLEKLYPDKVVISLNQTSSSLYNEIRNHLLDSDMKLGDYIESLGFTYIKRREKMKKKRILFSGNSIFLYFIILIGAFFCIYSIKF